MTRSPTMQVQFEREHAAPGRRRSLSGILAACLAVLVLAQAFTGVLTLSSMQRLFREAAVSKVEVIGLETVGKLESALRLGKSLGQFIGLPELLTDLSASLPEIDQAAIVTEGMLITPAGRTQAPPALAVAAEPGGKRAARRPAARGVVALGDSRFVVLPVQARNGAVVGALALRLNDAAITAAAEPALRHSLTMLAAATLAAIVSILVGFRLLLARRAAPPSRLQILALPLFGLVLAQGVYAYDTALTFRGTYLDVTRATVRSLGERVERDIEGLLARGLKLDGLSRVEEPLARIARSFPEILAIEIRNAEGDVLNAASARGLVVPAAADEETFAVELPLNGRSAEASPVGSLRVRLDPDVIAARVRDRLLDAATVTLISAVIVSELFFLLTILARAALSAADARHDAAIAKLARPLMFSFLFAWALPLSFLPLHARGLPAAWLDLPPNLIMALPISAEMLCALVTALAAGALTDRRGWHVPVLAGLALSIGGAVAAAFAGSFEGFLAGRCLVGLGYGFAWMGLQGFVVTTAPAAARGESLATLVAGIFAGHLSGSAIGAILSEHFGNGAVFLISAAVLLVTLAGSALLRAREGVPVPQATAPPPAAPVLRERRPGMISLIVSRDFGALLAGSVIPFSIVQVGLLYFALPIYLEAQGVSGSGVGRVLMIYGLSVICLGPLLGRLVDRAPNKRLFIPLAGLAGGGGLAFLYFNSGTPAILLAVFLLSLAGCLAQAAQSSYALGLERVQTYGPGFAFGVQRAADKLGQMLGPLVIGAMIALVGTANGLALTGLAYLGATMLFFIVTPRVQPAARSAT